MGNSLVWGSSLYARAVAPCQNKNFPAIVFIEVEVSFDSVSNVPLNSP